VKKGKKTNGKKKARWESGRNGKIGKEKRAKKSKQ